MKITKLSSKPAWFKPDVARRESFTDIFPNFDLVNKTFIWNGQDRKESTKDVSHVGWNITDGHGEAMGLTPKPGTENIYFVYDGAFNNIATSHGFPNNVGAHWNLGVDDTTASNIAALYLSVFVPSYGWNIIDGEFTRSADMNNFARVTFHLGRLIKEQYPNLKIGWWAHGNYTAHPYWQWFTNQQWRDHFNVTTSVEIDPEIPAWAFRSWDISECDAYGMQMAYPNEQIYSNSQSQEGSKKFNTGIKYISTWWEQQETQTGKHINYYRDVPGAGVKRFKSRPPKTASYSNAFGMYCATVGNGAEFWEAPYNLTNLKQFFLTEDQGSLSENVGGRPTYYKEEINLQTNWFALGMYYASKGNPIISANTQWLFPDYNFKGQLVTGNNKYPSFGRKGVIAPNGLPLVRMKYNLDKTKALVYVYYPGNPSATTQETINVVDTDVNVNLKVTGSWAELYLLEKDGSGEECNVDIQWDVTASPVCVGNFSNKLIEVVGNCNYMVEFSTDNVTWYNADQSTKGQTNNARVMSFSPTGNPAIIYYRVANLGLTGYGYTTTLSGCGEVVVNCSTTEANPHACSISNGTHHGYYDYQTNQAVGTFASQQGEYKLGNGAWKPTTFLGTGYNGLRYVGYKEPYQNAVIWTRTKSGCEEFYDGHCGTPRPVEVISYNHDYKVNLNTSPSHTGSVIDFAGFMTSNMLNNVWMNVDIYAFELYNAPSGVEWRINGGGWQSTTTSGSVTSFNNLGGAAANIPKDFVLELKQGGNQDKFIVRQWTNKGHFTNTTTVTRLRDGVVFVCSFVGDPNLASYIKFSNNTVVNCVNGRGLSFKLNSLSGDQIVTLGFQGTNTDWINIKLLNKDN